MKHIYSLPVINKILKGVLPYKTSDNLSLGTFPFSLAHPTGYFRYAISLIIIVIITENPHYMSDVCPRLIWHIGTVSLVRLSFDFTQIELAPSVLGQARKRPP